MKIVNLKCPYCGAPLTAKSTDKIVHCEYCGNTFALEEDKDKNEPVSFTSRNDLLRSRKIRTVVAVYIVLAIVIYAVTSLNQMTVEKQGSNDIVYLTTPQSEPMLQFVKKAFCKDTADITADDYASIKYLSISDDSIGSVIDWTFEYALQVDEDGNAVEPNTISFKTSEYAVYQDLECFSGLVVLNCNNCYEITGAGSSDWSFGNMKDLKYLSGGFNQSPQEYLGRLANPAQIVSLQLHCYSDDEISELSSYTNLERLNLDYISDSVTDLTGLGQLTSLQSLQLSLNDGSQSDLSFLSSMTSLKDLTVIGTPKSEAYLNNMPQLTSLSLEDDDSLKDLSFLDSMPEMHDLKLSNTALLDFSPLQNKSNLTSLYLSSDLDIDYSFLSSFSSLQSLTFYPYYKSTLPDLSGCTALIDVSVNDTSLPSLAGVTSLHTLQIDRSNYDVCDLSALSGMSGLQELAISGSGTADHAEVLYGLPSLTKMTVGSFKWTQNGNDQADETILFQLPALKELKFTKSLSGSYVHIDVNSMADNSSLESLDLSGINTWYLCTEVDGQMNQAQETSFSTFSDAFLSHFSNTKYLDVSSQSINDLSFVSNTPYLEKLIASDNYIKDISPLNGLQQLQLADLTNNPIADDSALSTGYLIQ